MRLVTYNVHRCVGVDGRLDVARVGAVLAALEPDIVCLQELDVGRARTGGVDQAQAIADILRMKSRFHPAMTVEEEQYGDALLTALPHTLMRTGALPTIRGVPGLEPRGALWVSIDTPDGPLQVITTHLGLVPREQRAQAAALIGPLWLGEARKRGPTVITGDLNAAWGSATYRAFNGRLCDVQRRRGLRAIATFPSSFPVLRIDHAFVSEGLVVDGVSTELGPLARKASDHLPLIIDLRLAAQAQARAA